MSNRQVGLRRDLTLFDAIAIIVGIMIGSGIFFIPTFVFQRAGSTGLALGVWIVAGLISILSGLCYAELGAAIPKAGGSYVYLREAFGPIWGFLNGWTEFLVGGPASIAALAVAFATYAGFFLPMTPWQIKLLAISAVVFLTVVNVLGVRQGAMVQRIFTVAKIIPILSIIAFGLLRSGTSQQAIFSLGNGTLSLGSFSLALVAALWAFTGWANVNSVAEELRDPARNLPLAMILGIGGVTLLYLFFNIALLKIMPMAAIVATQKPAAEAAAIMFGKIGAVIISGGALISIFGSTNGCVLAFPRNYFAMARDGLFFRQLAEIDPRFGTPVTSLIASALISILLIISGTFSQLTTLVVFTGMIFSTMVIVAVFVLRKKLPDLPRPYRVWGYPIVPVLVLALNLFLMVNSLMEDPTSSFIGLVVPVLGIPVYYWFAKKNAALVVESAD